MLGTAPCPTESASGKRKRPKYNAKGPGDLKVGGEEIIRDEGTLGYDTVLDEDSIDTEYWREELKHKKPPKLAIKATNDEAATQKNQTDYEAYWGSLEESKTRSTSDSEAGDVFLGDTDDTMLPHLSTCHKGSSELGVISSFAYSRSNFAPNIIPAAASLTLSAYSRNETLTCASASTWSQDDGLPWTGCTFPFVFPQLFPYYEKGGSADMMAGISSFAPSRSSYHASSTPMISASVIVTNSEEGCTIVEEDEGDSEGTPKSELVPSSTSSARTPSLCQQEMDVDEGESHCSDIYRKLDQQMLAADSDCCAQCGVQTHYTSILGRHNLTTVDVHDGVCIQCNPSLVPVSVFRKWKEHQQVSLKASLVSAVDHDRTMCISVKQIGVWSDLILLSINRFHSIDIMEKVIGFCQMWSVNERQSVIPCFCHWGDISKARAAATTKGGWFTIKQQRIDRAQTL